MWTLSDGEHVKPEPRVAAVWRQGTKPWIAAGGLAGLFVLYILVTLFFHRTDAEPEGDTLVSDSSEDVRRFRQPQQEKRFVEAVSRGKKDAIATLEDALEAAKQRGDADPNYVAELERQLAARKNELAEAVRQHGR